MAATKKKTATKKRVKATAKKSVKTKVESVKSVPIAPVAAKVEPHSWTDGGDKVLILKRVGADNTSYNGFQWPAEVGKTVECPDWNPAPECGGGLHGWAWGMALGEGMDFDIINNDVFLVLAAKPEDVIGNLEKGWKCKAKSVEIIERGSFGACWDKIKGGRDRLIEAMSKDPAVKDVASGDSSKAASSGNYSKAASSGDSSKAEQRGKAGIAASIGDGGYASAGEDGAVIVCYWDGKRYRVAIGYVGEDGIEADAKYKADKATGKLVKA